MHDDHLGRAMAARLCIAAEPSATQHSGHTGQKPIMGRPVYPFRPTFRPGKFNRGINFWQEFVQLAYQCRGLRSDAFARFRRPKSPNTSPPQMTRPSDVVRLYRYGAEVLRK